MVGFGATAAHAGPALTTTDATTTDATTTASTTTASTTTTQAPTGTSGGESGGTTTTTTPILPTLAGNPNLTVPSAPTSTLEPWDPRSCTASGTAGP